MSNKNLELLINEICSILQNKHEDNRDNLLLSSIKDNKISFDTLKLAANNLKNTSLVVLKTEQDVCNFLEINYALYKSITDGNSEEARNFLGRFYLRKSCHLKERYDEVVKIISFLETNNITVNKPIQKTKRKRVLKQL